MKIACLGWGSLIWQPEDILIHREWFSDGPFLPIEFTRQSNNGRLTLVITDGAKPLRTLWALMATEDLTSAKESLRIREGISKSKIDEYIGSVTTTDRVTEGIKLSIENWAKTTNLDAVIWTSLPSKFANVTRKIPTLGEAIIYLESLDANKRALAEEYIRKAPQQIDTEYRKKFEAQFGWIYFNISTD